MVDFFDLNKVWDWSRLLDPFPDNNWKFLLIGLGIFTGLIVLAILRAFWPGDLELKHRTEKMFLTIGIIGLFLVFFRWQGIPYFSARILLLILFIWFLIWLILIIYFRQLTMPKKILKIEAQKRKEKYL